MGKWKKKLRKFAKKAIPVIGLGLAATALARKRATDAPGDAHAKAKRLLTSDAAYAPKVDIVPEKKPVLFAKNKTANPNAIPHEEIFNARHGIGITEDPGWVDAKTGSRDDLMKFMTQKDNQNYAIRQKALKRARGTDYSVLGPSRHARGGRVGVGKAKRGFSKLLRKK